MNKVILLGCLLALIAVVSADVTKCFVCDKCEDGKDGTSTTCPDEKKAGCFIDQASKEPLTWNRGCTEKSQKDHCGTRTEECSVCTEDECNSASSIVSSVALSAIAALVLKAFY